MELISVVLRRSSVHASSSSHLSEALADPSMDDIVSFASSSDQSEPAAALMNATKRSTKSECKSAMMTLERILVKVEVKSNVESNLRCSVGCCSLCLTCHHARSRFLRAGNFSPLGLLEVSGIHLWPFHHRANDGHLAPHRKPVKGRLVVSR